MPKTKTNKVPINNHNSTSNKHKPKPRTIEPMKQYTSDIPKHKIYVRHAQNSWTVDIKKNEQ